MILANEMGRCRNVDWRRVPEKLAEPLHESTGIKRTTSEKPSRKLILESIRQKVSDIFSCPEFPDNCGAIVQRLVSQLAYLKKELKHGRQPSTAR